MDEQLTKPSSPIEPIERGSFHVLAEPALALSPDPKLARWFPSECQCLRLLVKFGTRVIPPPFLRRDSAARLRAEVGRLALEVDQDPILGPAQSVLGASTSLAHAWAYVPSASPGEKLSCLVFLHGNGGNCKLLAAAWRPFAEAQRVVVICPTFGLGFWGRGAVERIELIRSLALARWPIDPRRLDLAGLSDGGKGVVRVIRQHPDHYRGVILISATMPTSDLSDPSTAPSWRGRPVLILQGGRDWNVTRRSVERGAEWLRQHGAVLTMRIEPDEDHGLFFTQRHQVAAWVAEWRRILGGSLDSTNPALPEFSPGQ